MIFNAFQKSILNAASSVNPKNMASSKDTIAQSLSYREWKESKNNTRPPILAIGTTAGTGGVRMFDHILYPQSFINKNTPITEKSKKKLHRNVAVQTEPQHDIIRYTSKTKPPPFMLWRLNTRGYDSDSDSDEDPYFQVSQIKSD